MIRSYCQDEWKDENHFDLEQHENYLDYLKDQEREILIDDLYFEPPNENLLKHLKEH